MASRFSHRTAVLSDLYEKESNRCGQKGCGECTLKQTAKQAAVAAGEFVIWLKRSD